MKILSRRLILSPSQLASTIFPSLSRHKIMQGHNHLPNTALVSILKHILYITSRMLHDRPHKSHEDASPPAPETMSDAEVNARLIFPDPIKIQCTESKAPMPKKYSRYFRKPMFESLSMLTQRRWGQKSAGQNSKRCPICLFSDPRK